MLHFPLITSVTNKGENGTIPDAPGNELPHASDLGLNNKYLQERFRPRWRFFCKAESPCIGGRGKGAEAVKTAWRTRLETLPWAKY